MVASGKESEAVVLEENPWHLACLKGEGLIRKLY
jgi:hypothetical protein